LVNEQVSEGRSYYLHSVHGQTVEVTPAVVIADRDGSVKSACEGEDAAAVVSGLWA